MSHLGIPRGSRRLEVDVLTKCLHNDVHDIDYKEETRGRKCAVKKGSEEEYIILKCVMRQLSIICCTAYVNERRD